MLQPPRYAKPSMERNSGWPGCTSSSNSQAQCDFLRRGPCRKGWYFFVLAELPENRLLRGQTPRHTLPTVCPDENKRVDLNFGCSPHVGNIQIHSVSTAWCQLQPKIETRVEVWRRWWNRCSLAHTHSAVGCRPHNLPWFILWQLCCDRSYQFQLGLLGHGRSLEAI